MSVFEAVIGLEVHAQLMTRSKLFCRASSEVNALDEANSRVDVVSAGLPGALPVLNRRAVEMAVRAGIACQCEIQEHSIFERKNYFYADLPKGYQISQLEKPICLGGKIQWQSDGAEMSVELERIHMEEDAGQLVHVAQSSLVNLNRAGTPLIEIVSKPVIHSAKHAREYLQTLHSLLVHAEVTDGNLEEGNFRCDANVSVRPVGEPKLGTRTEIKNLNSFRFVEAAIEYEISRQISVINAGGTIVQETRAWDSAASKTLSMRTKEESADYRYFPDPDLPHLHLSKDEVAKIRAQMPALPDELKKRLMAEWGISAYDVGVYLGNKESLDYAKAVVQLGVDPALVTSWVQTDMAGELKNLGVAFENIGMSPQETAELLGYVKEEKISRMVAKDMLKKCLSNHGFDWKTFVAAEGLLQSNDSGAIVDWVDEVVAENAAMVEEYRAGKTKVLGFLVGQVMKKSGGSANPKMVSTELKKKLGQP